MIREASSRSWMPVALMVCAQLLTPVGAHAQSPVPPLDRPISLERSDVTLREILTTLQQASGVNLVYSPDLVPVERLVTCSCLDTTLGEALRKVLAGTDLTTDVLGNQVRIIPGRPDPDQPTVGQIAGRILSREDRNPVRNALIQLSDGRGSLTNEHGQFILVNVPPGTYSLSVTGLGWEEKEVRDILVLAGGTATVEVELVRRVVPLSSLVVSPGTFTVLDGVEDFALQTLSREQIETVPQVGEDVFRSLRRLPGVASDDISTRLHLRGGTDREVLILLDGMELYDPYHLKDFEGALGIVDINAIGGIDLHAGGFPVDFGDRSAGVFDMESRTPPSQGMRTTLGLSITNATVMSQGAFAGGRGQWLFSGRRGYMDLAFKLTEVNDDINPRYYDFLGKVQLQLGARHLVSAHILAAKDDLWLDPDALDDNETGALSTGYGNAYGWLTWKAFPTPRVKARTLLSGGRISRERVGNLTSPGRVEGPESLDVTDEASFEFVGVKQDWTLDLWDRMALRTGVSVNRLFGHYDYAAQTETLRADADGKLVGVLKTSRVNFDPTGTQVGAYGTLRVRPVPRLTTEFGLRYDRSTHTGDSDLSPRLHALLDMGSRTKLRAGWGLYHQSQGIHELEAADEEMTFGPSERSSQTALGVEHQMENGISGRVEVYQRRVDRPRRMYLNLWREILPFPELDGDRLRVDPTEGRAKGVEILAKRDGKVWDWSATYSLSSTESRIDGDWIPNYWDQRHAFSLTVGFHPGDKWTVTGAWQIHSGWPFTPQLIEFDTLTVFQGEGLENPLRWREEFGTLNSQRLPAYHRLDLRVTRRFEFQRGTLDAYLDLFNAYNQMNLRSYDYNVQVIGNDLKWVRHPDEGLLPILPSLGFRWEF